jgi:hypothetical protein
MQQHAAVRDPAGRRLAIHGLHIPEDIEGIAHDGRLLEPEGDTATVRRNGGTGEVRNLQKSAWRDRFRVQGTATKKQYASQYHYFLDEGEHSAFLDRVEFDRA